MAAVNRGCVITPMIVGDSVLKFEHNPDNRRQDTI
jgi:hypothetical protein